MINSKQFKIIAKTSLQGSDLLLGRSLSIATDRILTPTGFRHKEIYHFVYLKCPSSRGTVNGRHGWKQGPRDLCHFISRLCQPLGWFHFQTYSYEVAEMASGSSGPPPQASPILGAQGFQQKSCLESYRATESPAPLHYTSNTILHSPLAPIDWQGPKPGAWGAPNHMD